MDKLEILKSEHWSVTIPSEKWEELGADIDEIEELGVSIENLPAMNLIAVYERDYPTNPETINFYYRFENYGVLYHTFGVIPEADQTPEENFLRWIPTIFFGGYIDWEELIDHL